MTRTLKHSTVSRVMRAALAVALAAFLLLPMGFMPMHPSEAYAETVPTWTLAEVRTFAHVEDPANITLTTTDDGVDSKVHIKFVDGWIEESARGGVSWNERITWSTPPSTIAVGSENDVLLSVEGSYSNYAYDEGASPNTNHRYYSNDFVAATEALPTGSLVPLNEPAFCNDFLVFDESRISISDLLNDYESRASKYEYFHYPDSVRDYGSSVAGNILMPYEHEWEMPSTDPRDMPSASSVSNNCRALVREHNAAEKQRPIPFPTLKLVITGATYGYRRDNGVLVIPIGCLRD